MNDEQILYDPTAEPRILASGLAILGVHAPDEMR